MSPWEIVITAVGSFLVYGTIAVWVGFDMWSLIWARYRWHVDSNPAAHKPNPDRFGFSRPDCDCRPPYEPGGNACAVGFVWPLGMWLLLGLHLVFRADRQRADHRQLDAIRRELEQL